MPLVSLLLRLAARIALMRLLRGGVRTPPPWRTPGHGAGPAAWSSPAARGVLGQRVGSALATAAELTRLGARVLAAFVFGAAAATLVAAGTTLTSLGPRWLGISLLVLAVAATVVAVLELRAVVRLRDDVRRRVHADRLRREVSSLPS